MWRYVIRRILWLPIILFIVSFITFLLFRVVPGDPIMVILGDRYEPDSIATINLRHELGYDQPIIVQYTKYMGGVLRGDFGKSSKHGMLPVRDLIFPKMWVSAQLALVGLLISLIFGVPLGFFIAHHQGTWYDPTSVVITLVLMSIAPMISVPGLLWLFCLKLHWVPCSGWNGIFDGRILVPAIALGVPGIAGFVRLMRASTLDVLGQEFIRTARAKGLSVLIIDIRHVLRNAIIPVVTILAFSLAGLIGGAIVTETIMGIPGIGYFAIQSVFNRDYDVLMAVTLVTAFTFVIAMLIADISYSIIDPRIEYE